jgi:hypothetical protein
MSSSDEASGFGLAGTLLIVFIILKLIGVISWSWWWVLSPLWGAVVVVVLLGVILAIIKKI